MAWTDADRVAARREGWDVFDLDQADGPRVCRLDDPEAWRATGVTVEETWDDDTAVWEYIQADTSPLHEKAVEIVRDTNPAEYRAMRQWVTRNVDPNRPGRAPGRLDDNRLSDDDRRTMELAVADRTAAWQRQFSNLDIAKDVNRAALEYRAARAIGCGLADLRDSELDEIKELVDTAIKSASGDHSASNNPQPAAADKTGSNRVARTWLDSGPAWMDSIERRHWRETVDNVVANLDRYFPDDQADYLERASGDRAYSFWLRLVDEQLAELPTSSRGPLLFPWRETYEKGWPPREAACTAWSGLGERPDVLEAVHVAATTPRPAQPPERGGFRG